jgi:hypothetical protein
LGDAGSGDELLTLTSSTSVGKAGHQDINLMRETLAKLERQVIKLKDKKQFMSITIKFIHDDARMSIEEIKFQLLEAVGCWQVSHK